MINNDKSPKQGTIPVGTAVRIITGQLAGRAGTIQKILDDTMPRPDGSSAPMHYYIVKYTTTGLQDTYFAGRENIEPLSHTVETLQFALTQIYPPIPAGEVEVSSLLKYIQKELENPDEAIAAALSSVRKRYKYEFGKGTPAFWFTRLINRKIDEQRRRQKKEGTYRDPYLTPVPVNFIEDDDDDE